MELRGETMIAAPRMSVWAALNDPEVLARCIDGVERLERESDTRFSGSMVATVGPVKAKFTGTVNLTELDPPNRYVLVGEGKGGVAGFVKGQAEVTLTDAEGGGTQLTYVAQSQVGGKLAQLGGRLIEGTAKGYAARFFERLKAEVETPAAAAEVAEQTEQPDNAADAVATPASAPSPVPQSAPGGLPPAVWITLLVVLVLLLLVYLWQ